MSLTKRCLMSLWLTLVELDAPASVDSENGRGRWKMSREKMNGEKRMVIVMMIFVVHLRCRCDDDRRRHCCRSSSPLPSSSFTFLSSFFVTSSFFVSSFFFVVVVSFLMSFFLLSLLPSWCPVVVVVVVVMVVSPLLPLLSLLSGFFCHCCHCCLHCFADSDASLPLMTMTKGSRWVVVKDVFSLFFAAVC